MSQEIEIEFKNLITENQYQKLMNHYSTLQGPILKQVNHYFDTESFSLKALRAALRVRYKKKNFILTLKQPHSIGLLETHQNIDDNEFDSLKEQGTISSGEVLYQLEGLFGEQPIPQLCYLGQLTTERTEIPLKEGLLVLDKSYYFNQVDYEIEFECEEENKGKADFQKLIDSWGLDWIEPPNKIERFYRIKQQMDNESI